MKKTKLLCLLLALVMLIALPSCGGTDTTAEDESDLTSSLLTEEDFAEEEPVEDEESTNPAEGMYQPPALDEDLTYFADIEIQDYGTITVRLDKETAPITVANFVDLAESGFYDGLTFHRIMEGFMMQGGDPEGNGLGGSENNIYGEFSGNGFENNLSHTRGVISMARAQDLNSASSQFFICHVDSTFLDGGYAAFGEVIEGIEVVDAVCAAAEPIDQNGTISPEDQPVMTSVTIRTE